MGGSAERILVCDRRECLPNGCEAMVDLLVRGLPGSKVEILEYEGREAFLAHLRGATALITAFLPLDAETLAQAPGLRVVSIAATGYDNVDLAAASRLGIGVCPIGEYCTRDVAEHAIALMLALNKNLKAYDQDVELAGRWNYNDAPVPRRIGSQCLGIFGLGKIGRQVARLAQGLGMTVVACDPYVKGTRALELGVRLVEKDELLSQADVISNHMNLGEDNAAFFTLKEFEKMRRHPIFLNLGRGASVNEEDLARALDLGLVRAAGLDVLSTEDPNLKQNALLGRKNVIITPHAAFLSQDSLEDLERIPCENVIHYLKGEYDQVFRLVNNPSPATGA